MGTRGHQFRERLSPTPHLSAVVPRPICSRLLLQTTQWSGLDALPHRWSAPTAELPTEPAITAAMREDPSFVAMRKELPMHSKEVLFLTWQRMLAHNWVAALVEAIGGVYSRMTAAGIVREFVIRPVILLL